MRILNLDGARARYERLRLLDKAEAYGHALSAEATAPFAVRWDENRKIAGVFLEDTLLAHVDISRGEPTLEVREDYPCQFDHVLLRAINNAADLTDQVGKMKRAEDRTKMQPEKLLRRNPDDFILWLKDADQLHRALMGASALENLRYEFDESEKEGYPCFHVNVQSNNRDHEFKILTMSRDRLFVMQGARDTYGVQTRAFRVLMDEGLRVFNERFVPETFMTACKTLIAHTPLIDAESLLSDYNARNRQTLRAVKTFTTGPFKTLDGPYHREHIYHGMRFSSAAYGYKNSLLPKSVPVDPQIFNQAVEILTLRWTAETLGKRVSDYPLLTADLIAEKINAADFGYTL